MSSPYKLNKEEEALGRGFLHSIYPLVGSLAYYPLKPTLIPHPLISNHLLVIY